MYQMTANEGNCDNTYDAITLYQLFNNEQMLQYCLDKFPWAKDYLYYYIYVIYARRESILPTLSSISDREQKDFSFEKAYEYYSNYEKSKLNVGIVIPTCNRPEAIRFLLGYSAPLNRRLGVDIIVYDSSDNEKTRNIVNEFRENGYYNVSYQRYGGLFDGFSLDHKIMQIYTDYADCYDYIWVCRDGLVPVIDEIIEKLRYYKESNVGCIIVDAKSRNEGIEKEKCYEKIEDCGLFLREQAHRLQTLGMLIFSGEFAKQLVKTEPINDDNYSLWQMAAPFHSFAKVPFKVVFFSRNVFATNEKAVDTHFWGKAEKTIRQWGERWYHIIMSMPDVYNEVKEECLMVYTVDFHPFSARLVMELRAYGGLNAIIVCKNSSILKQVTKTPMWYFYTISLCPKWLLKIILHYNDNHKGVFSSIRKKLIPNINDY